MLISTLGSITHGPRAEMRAGFEPRTSRSFRLLRHQQGSDRQKFPDAPKTPGFANSDLTQDNIAENLCNPLGVRKRFALRRPTRIRLNSHTCSNTAIRWQDKHQSPASMAALLVLGAKTCFSTQVASGIPHTLAEPSRYSPAANRIAGLNQLGLAHGQLADALASGCEDGVSD